MIKVASFLFVFTTLFSLSAAKHSTISEDGPVTTATAPSNKKFDMEGCAISLAKQDGISLEDATKRLQELMDQIHVPSIPK